MVRKLLLITVLVSVLSFCFAQTYTLDAGLTDATQGNLDITNCKSPSGGPTMQKISIRITNTMPVRMKVSYKYLDLPSNTYNDGLEAVTCVVPPSFSSSCVFTIPITLGGTGNGTGKDALNNVELLRLNGQDVDGKRKEVYSKSLFFSIGHEEIIPETNVYGKIKEARAFLSQLTSKVPCAGNVCCGMGGSLEKVEKARLDIQNAEEYMKLCNMTASYDFASSAFANAKSAASTSTDAGECRGALDNYESAKVAVDSASEQIRGLGCQVGTDSSNYLENAKSKLANAGILIGSDDYESASLELESAKSAAALAKSSAKCETGSVGQGTGSQGSGSSSGGTGSGSGSATGSGTKEPPLCPIGMAAIATIGLGAFAYSKR